MNGLCRLWEAWSRKELVCKKGGTNDGKLEIIMYND